MAGLTAVDFTGNGVPFQCLLLPRKGPRNGLPSNSTITRADYTFISQTIFAGKDIKNSINAASQPHTAVKNAGPELKINSRPFWERAEVCWRSDLEKRGENKSRKEKA